MNELTNPPSSLHRPEHVQTRKRRGAYRPGWDPDFNNADPPIMIRLADLPARDRKHFPGR